MAERREDAERFSNLLERKFEQVLTPFQEFVRDETTASILLLICTVIAFVIAHSPWSDAYESFWHMPIGIYLDQWTLEKSARHWVNDGLMALFFFVIGLEIKRELLGGELQNIRRSIPVMASAIGGMVVPALIYALFNSTGVEARGWGIPVATDTAFAVGVLALLGRRVPAALAVFLTALAIIDDIGSVLIIALFYTETLSIPHIVTALVLLGVLVLLNVIGVRRPFPYLFVGALVWLAMLQSGIHAAVAGVVVAFTVPARPRHGPFWFLRRARRLINEFAVLERKKERYNNDSPSILATDGQHVIVERVKSAALEATTPLQLWERALESPVALLVLPIFALANAAVPISLSALPSLLANPISLGIVLGLVVGKVTGITAMCWLVLKLKLGELPREMRFTHVIGIGLLGGMGFTMSIFIAGLGFDAYQEQLLVAKGATLFASAVAGVSGYLWLRFVK